MIHQAEQHAKHRILLLPVGGAWDEFSDTRTLRSIRKPPSPSELLDAAVGLICGLGGAEETEETTLVGSETIGRVLLAEDHPTNRMYAGELLKRIGVEVVFAEDGKLAVSAVEAAKAEGRPFDLILMDCQMPHMSGFDATRALRSAGESLPIVALTANAIKGDRERCLEAGMDDYLTKPVEPAALSAVVKRHMKTMAGFSGGEAAATTEASERADEEAIMNLPEALGRCLNDAGFLAKALEGFATQSPKYLEAAVAAVEAGDVEATSHAAHSLKGVAAMLSATRLTAAAAQLELACREERFEEAATLICDVCRETERAVDFARSIDPGAVAHLG